MSRRVLITGAGGFVGSHLAVGFAKLGDQVTAFDRQFDAETAARLSGLDRVEAPLDRNRLAELGRFDLVIHGAALTSTAHDLGISETAHIKANLDLLLDCLEFARGSEASQFVFLSSSGVFGSSDGSDLLLETMAATGTTPYAVAKRMGEIVVEAAAGERFTAFSIRLGPIFGPFEVSRESRKTVSQVRLWLDAALANQPLVVKLPASRRDWTYAPDLAPALDKLLGDDTTPPSVLHFCSPELTSEIALAQTIAALVPGTRIEMAEGEAPLRLPMASMRRDMAALHDWMPLADGLSQILTAEAHP